jgi:hypothetical protein
MFRGLNRQARREIWAGGRPSRVEQSLQRRKGGDGYYGGGWSPRGAAVAEEAQPEVPEALAGPLRSRPLPPLRTRCREVNLARSTPPPHLSRFRQPRNPSADGRSSNCVYSWSYCAAVGAARGFALGPR